MSRTPANERFRRLLSIVPWIAARDGPTIDEVCARFDLEREQLLADLDVVFMVGLYPYTPDELVDVRIEDDRVWIDYADFFARPLRLTPEQGLGLVAAGSSLLAVPGADPNGPLARGLDKLATVLGVEPGATLEIELGEVPPETLELLERAVREHRTVEIDYYTYGRDEHTRRVIEPGRVYADQGDWYVAAWCRRAEGERVFRIDRIHEAHLRDETFEPPHEQPALSVFDPAPDDPRVELELEPGGRWVLEQYPTEAVAELGAGRCRVTLAITAPAWLERLLLRLGRDARVVSGPPELCEAGRRAARRILERYRSGTG